MLVLSRKKNESIVINDDIAVVVVEIRGDKVRLGVEAPKKVPVHRREVFDAIHKITRVPPNQSLLPEYCRTVENEKNIGANAIRLEDAAERTANQNPGAFNSDDLRIIDEEAA